MRRILYNMHLWSGYMRMGVVMLTQYPADTFVWVISMLLREASGFLGVLVIASAAGGLGGWSVYEICLMFSMCAIIEAIGQAFFDNVWGVSFAVRKGLMDVFLVRPASVLIQLLGSSFHFQALISMVAYLGILIFSIIKLHIFFHLGIFFFLIEYVVCATIINSGIYLIFNCLNFWIVQGDDIAVLVQTCREFAKYPLSVFPMAIKYLFTYVIPFGVIGYYPAAYLTGKSGMEVVWMLPICAAVVAIVAGILWRLGLKSYNSTGT